MSRLRALALVVTAALCAGCATTPSIGSRVWHEDRTAEIERAYDAYEIDEAQYLELKNDADQIRSEYLDRMELRRARHYRSIGFGFGHHHYWGHHHRHW